MMIYRVSQAFEKHKVDYAICGGWAVALHGAVRGTVDLDLILTLTRENFERAEKALKTIGLESRLPVTASEVIQFREEFIRNRNMLAWRFVNPTDHTQIVDILMIEDLKKIRKKIITLGKHKIPVVSIGDLIRMKKESGRPQDLEDVKALEILNE